MIIDDLQAVSSLAASGIPTALVDGPRARPCLHIVTVDAGRCRGECPPLVDEDRRTIGSEHSDRPRRSEHLRRKRIRKAPRPGAPGVTGCDRAFSPGSEHLSVGEPAPAGERCGDDALVAEISQTAPKKARRIDA